MFYVFINLSLTCYFAVKLKIEKTRHLVKLIHNSGRGSLPSGCGTGKGRPGVLNRDHFLCLQLRGGCTGVYLMQVGKRETRYKLTQLCFSTRI